MKKNNKNLLYVLIIIILLAICMFSKSILPNTEKNEENKINENIEPEEFIVKLHFGNGEIYQSPANYIYYPIHDIRLSNYTFRKNKPDGFSFYLISDGKYLQNSGAELSNGYFYSFSECYKAAYDDESKIIAIYLWRDEPYTLEKTIFEKTNK